MNEWTWSQRPKEANILKLDNLAILDRFSKDYTKALRSKQHTRVII
jgi:hypothetical protein